RKMRLAVRRNLAVCGTEELRDLVDIQRHVRRRRAVLVEPAADQHQPLHEIWALNADLQGYDRPIAMPDQVGRLTHHLLQERDHVIGHQLIGDRPLDVRCVPVTPALWEKDVESLGQRPDIRLEESPIDEPAVHHYQRITLATLVVPGPNLSQLHCCTHGGPPPSSPRRVIRLRSMAVPGSGYRRSLAPRACRMSKASVLACAALMKPAVITAAVLPAATLT